MPLPADGKLASTQAAELRARLPRSARLALREIAALGLDGEVIEQDEKAVKIEE